MGQSPSSIRSRGSRRSLRSFTRRSKLNKSSLSHTFNMPPSEEYPELMNVNIATEEQLMTLPGVNRQLAQEIVRHRQMIGRFKRVDDLALVSGIGAEKLELLRPEICTGSRKQVSRASSSTQSLDSVRLTSDTKLCSVNSSSVFQLQCVPGLNQEIAANIVDYRNKKGPFKSLDDLIKVRGMDIVRLSTVKQHLTLEHRKCESVQNLNNGHLNGFRDLTISDSLFNGTRTPRTPHRKSLSVPTKFPMTLPNGFATAPVNDIFDLLSAYSHRPIVEEVFTYERNGVKCCRLASWNIHQLSIDKIMNPGVREVVCRTILENKLSIIAIQDVVDVGALKIVCDELNSPGLRRVREWPANSHQWEYCISTGIDGQQLGFVYDSATNGIIIEDIDLEQLCLLFGSSEVRRLVDLLLELRSDRYTAAPQAFLVCGRPLVVVNVQCTARLDERDGAALRRAADAAHAALAAGGAPALLLAGDFLARDNVTAVSNCEPLLPEDVVTTVDGNTSGGSGILLAGAGAAAGLAFSGHAGAVRAGLGHLAIPRGWAWGGPASPHCPVWADMQLPATR